MMLLDTVRGQRGLQAAYDRVGVGALMVASYVTTIDDHDLSGAAAACGDAPRLTRRRAA